MASTYSDLKFELIGTGEQSGVWGTTTNDNIGTAIEQALVGLGNPIFTTDANLTISLTNTVALQTARALVLNATSSGSLTATRELVVPTIEKQYIVQNNTTGGQSITVKTTAGTGITVTNGRKAHLYVDGVNVIQMFDFVDINGGAIDGTPIGASSASTGAFTTLAASGAVTLSGGTANGVAYLNGSKVLTSGSALTFDGSQTFKVRQNTAGTGNYSELVLDIANTFSAGGQSYLRNISLNGGNSSTALAFGVNADGGGAPAEGMRLTYTGLGIGTSLPGGALHVSNASASVKLLLTRTGSSGNTQMGFENSSGTRYMGVFSDRFIIGTAADLSSSAQATIDSSGNLGLGVTPSAWGSVWKATQIQVGAFIASQTNSNDIIHIGTNAFANSSNAWTYINTAPSTRYVQSQGAHSWHTAASGTAGNAITFTQAMTLDSSGNLLVGTTSNFGTSRAYLVATGLNTTLALKGDNSASFTEAVWNASTTGDSKWIEFASETSYTARGSISYNRAAGLTVYATTSDYRAKDIIGPVTDSGALIDSTPVYMGKMKGATQERPMFIAHEVPAYAHTGEKDAVDADGNPVYQQMDASALVPVLWAEIQSLRARVAALESN